MGKLRDRKLHNLPKLTEWRDPEFEDRLTSQDSQPPYNVPQAYSMPLYLCDFVYTVPSP